RPPLSPARMDEYAGGDGASRAARAGLARSRETHLGARQSGALGPSSPGRRLVSRTHMRVTMMVRCLAMMRGGGETRHLAWMRELAAMGVDVDVIAGEPLLLGTARHPVTDVPATVLRTPYLRDAVYRWQNTRGFGRATTAALHLDEEWFCRAAWRDI